MSESSFFKNLKQNKRFLNLIIVFGTLLLVALLDQISKRLIVSNMEEHDSVTLIKGVLNITYITNKGSAFGMLANNRWVFMVLSVLGIGAMIAYAVRSANKSRVLTMVSLGMVIGGGIGNMIDRIFNGSVLGDGTVIDFIDVCLIPDLWMWIFNVADAFVCVGCALLVICIILDEVKSAKEKKAPGIAAGAEKENEPEDGNEPSGGTEV